MEQIWLWLGFNVFVLALLAVDLGVFHRNAHVVSIKEATGWSVAWITLALAFNAGVYAFMGPGAGLEFLTGYLIEKALSVDNIFVFVLIFAYFQVPPKYQHRVLFWGIIGALLMRAGMIGAGAYLIMQFHWIIYVFGGFLVFTGIKMARQSELALEPETNPVVRLVRRLMPVTGTYHGPAFFVRQEVAARDSDPVATTGDGGAAAVARDEGTGAAGSTRGKLVRWVATPLFVVLVLVEATDLIFAVDSIPAIFAVTTDPFLVYTSNVFAILGLRSLYFLLAGVIHKFHFLKLGLSVVLGFVGTKMLLTDLYKVPIGVSLAAIAAILAVSVVASLLFPKEVKEHDPVKHEPLPDQEAAA